MLNVSKKRPSPLKFNMNDIGIRQNIETKPLLEVKIDEKNQDISNENIGVNPIGNISNPILEVKIDQPNVDNDRITSIDNFLRTVPLMEECPKLTLKGKGGFGTVGIDNADGKFKKIIPTILNPFIRGATDENWDWMFERFKYFCHDMNRYSREAKELFPNNIIDYGITECDYCNPENGTYAIILTLEEIKTSNNFKDKIMDLSKDQINSIMTQLYYIALKLNSVNLWHNDYKPENIMINKTNKDITYSGIQIDNKCIDLIIKKGSYIPIIIDYDFCSFEYLLSKDINPIEREDLFWVNMDIQKGDFSYMAHKIFKYTGNFSQWTEIPTLFTGDIQILTLDMLIHILSYALPDNGEILLKNNQKQIKKGSCRRKKFNNRNISQRKRILN